MDRPVPAEEWSQGLCARNLAHAAFAAMFALAAAQAMPAAAADLSDGDKTCLGCHSQAGFAKDLGGGQTLSLQVQGEAFAKSVHAPLGCTACHSDIKLDQHPRVTKKITSTREYSIAMVEVCGGCHEDAARLNAASIHATRLKAGNEWAPVCTDCHSSHAILPKTAYDTCVACHATAMEGHRKWLPNAALHLEVVACAACHAPAAKRMVDLRLYDGEAKKWAVEKESAPEFEKLARAADTDRNGLGAFELHNLMAQINRDKTVSQKSLRGRIELRTGVEAHRLSGKTDAIKECATCHQRNAEPFQIVTVSINSADGKPTRYEAHRDVLSSVLSVESLGEFYAVGGTRNIVLDILLILAVLAGLSVPIVHQIMKRIVRRLEAKRAAGTAGNPHSSAPGAKSDDGDTPPK